MAEGRANTPRTAGNGSAEGRVPPQALEVEQAVLGAMLLEQSAATTAIEMLEPDSFYKQAHQVIFRVMRDLYKRNEPIDQISVIEELRRRGELDNIGSVMYITELLTSVSTAAHIESHCRILSEKALARAIIERTITTLSHCYDQSADAFSLLDEASASLFKLSQLHMKRSYIPMERAVKDVMELIDSIQDQHHGITGVPTGFSELDNLTGGFQPSDLIIIAARPSMGKTALSLSIARNAAIDHNRAVAFFSLEMAAPQLTMRLLCAEARVNMHHVRTGRLREDDWPRLSQHFGRLAGAKIFIDDTPALNILELRAKARRLKEEHDISLVIVDYLQLMHAPKAESREREISMISSSLKELAKDLNVPVVALSQLNRSIEHRSDPIPMLSDLRESGSIEQDADVVIFVHRNLHKREDGGGDDEGKAKIIIGKQRNGPTGQLELAFVKEYARFENLEMRFLEEAAPPSDAETPAF